MADSNDIQRARHSRARFVLALLSVSAVLALAVLPAGGAQDVAVISAIRLPRVSPAVDSYFPRGARVMNARLLA